MIKVDNNRIIETFTDGFTHIIFFFGFTHNYPYATEHKQLCTIKRLSLLSSLHFL